MEGGSAVGFDSAGGVEAIGAVVDVACAEAGATGLVHLEVKVGEVFAVGIADASDVLAANDGFVKGGADGLQVGIHGLHDAAVGEAMGDDEGFAPAGVGLAGVDDESVADGVDRVAEVGVHAADAVEVVAGMAAATLGVHFPEGLGVVGEGAVSGADGVVEATGEGDAEAVDAGEHFEPMVEGGDDPASLEFARLAVGGVGFLGGAKATNAGAFCLFLPPHGVDEKGGR